MKRILVITCSLESPNGICIKAILEEAERRKIKVDCVCSAGAVQNTEFITYYLTPRRLLDQFYYGDRQIDSLQFKLSLWALRLGSLAMAPAWPFSAPAYYGHLKKLCLQLADQNHYDAVIGTYNFYETLLAAYEVKKRHMSIKFIPYFLDCLSGGRGPRYRSVETIRCLGLKKERSILPSADRIVIMKSHEEFYRDLWSEESWIDRVSVLDIPLLCNIVQQNGISEPKSRVNVVYTGALQVDLKNPGYFLNVLHCDDFADLNVTFVGPSNCDELIQKAGKHSKTCITQLPPVSHEKAVELMRSADILLNIGSKNARQIPCKIFEYMAAGKPIITTAPIHDEPSLKYLSKYPAALILYEDDPPELSSKKLRKFLNNIGNMKIDTSKLEKDFYICTPKAFVDLIEE